MMIQRETGASLVIMQIRKRGRRRCSNRTKANSIIATTLTSPTTPNQTTTTTTTTTTFATTTTTTTTFTTTTIMNDSSIIYKSMKSMKSMANLMIISLITMQLINVNNMIFRTAQTMVVNGDDIKHHHHDLHRFFDQKDLRRTFQVDSHDQVPSFELVELIVKDNGPHLISPINDLKQLLPNQHHQQTTSTTTTTTNLDQQQIITSSNHQLNNKEEAKHHNHDQAITTASIHQSESQIKRDKRDTQPPTNNNNNNNNNKVNIDLSTFGQDFKLRLKPNLDFQRRLKDMKIFMAETTKDGQLRYSEIKSSNNHQHADCQISSQSNSNECRQKEKLTTTTNGDGTVGKATSSSNLSPVATAAAAEVANASSSSSLPAPSANNISLTVPVPVTTTTTTTTTTTMGQATKDETLSNGNSKRNDDPDSFSIYHDEENLAALLINRGINGQLQVDGTIGNDFVIKPLPHGALEAAKKHAAATIHNSTTPVDSGSSSSSKSVEPPKLNDSTIESRIYHMHDDDPHDDDEMFLDEDEAFELAHLSHHQLNITSKLPQQQQQQQPTNNNNNTNTTDNNVDTAHKWRPLDQSKHKISIMGSNNEKILLQRPTLSKLASERKWKKLAKLQAQLQVPKLVASTNIRAALNYDNENAASELRPQLEEQPLNNVLSSHHIIYRQRPSSEMSPEHMNSFMVSPSTIKQQGDDSRLLSELSLNLNRPFDSHRLFKQHNKRSVSNEHDTKHDHMDSQFLLEPGSFMGYGRAGFDNWTFATSGQQQQQHQQHKLGANHDNNNHYSMSPITTTTNNNSNNSIHMSRPHDKQTNSSSSSKMVKNRFKRTINQRRFKRQAPETVWPEVLLVVDYDSYLLHGADSRDVKRYFVSFWNGVDLRYKLLVHPRIRISLAGMIVAKDRDATPYLERNRLRAPNADAVDAAGALTDMGKYLYREDRLPTYDLAVVITKLDMCRRRYEGGRCNRGTAGFAYVGGACVVNKRLEKVNSVAIIEDSGGFSGIIVAAHEVGHLLGCVHDGSPPPSYLGGPGATHCPWEDGFIMSDLRHTERGFRWSQCSVEQFKHFLNGETATCLYNYPHESQTLHRMLPGTMLTLDEQCKRDRGTNACFKDARVCAQLFCFDSASGYCVSYRPAAEGSPCGDGQVCRNGKCVGEIENIIPDYTHVSHTVVARRSQAGRQADQGISASSTSTATTTPDKLTVRMDNGLESNTNQFDNNINKLINGVNHNQQHKSHYSRAPPLSSFSKRDGHLIASNHQHSKPNPTSTTTSTWSQQHKRAQITNNNRQVNSLSPTTLVASSLHQPIDYNAVSMNLRSTFNHHLATSPTTTVSMMARQPNVDVVATNNNSNNNNQRKQTTSTRAATTINNNNNNNNNNNQTSNRLLLSSSSISPNYQTHPQDISSPITIVSSPDLSSMASQTSATTKVYQQHQRHLQSSNNQPSLLSVNGVVTQHTNRRQTKQQLPTTSTARQQQQNHHHQSSGQHQQQHQHQLDRKQRTNSTSNDDVTQSMTIVASGRGVVVNQSGNHVKPINRSQRDTTTTTTATGVGTNNNNLMTSASAISVASVAVPITMTIDQYDDAIRLKQQQQQQQHFNRPIVDIGTSQQQGERTMPNSELSHKQQHVVSSSRSRGAVDENNGVVAPSQTTVTTTSNGNNNKIIGNIKEQCQDLVTNVTEALNCTQFLKQYPHDCNHIYIQSFCCKSRSLICDI